MGKYVTNITSLYRTIAPLVYWKEFAFYGELIKLSMNSLQCLTRLAGSEEIHKLLAIG